MSNCSTLIKGIATACQSNLGGIRSIAIGDWESIDKTGIAIDTNEVISAMTSSTKFVTFVAAKNTAGITSTLTKDETNGTQFWTNTFTFHINHLEAEKRMEINALTKGHVALLVTDRNGHTWFMGKDDYVVVSEATAQSGAAPEDGNFYAITFTDNSMDLPHEVASTVVAGLIA